MNNKELMLTKETLEAYKKELDHLINVERKNVIQEIKDARNQGDLSENAEYDSAREKQGFIESRISELEHIIANSSILQDADARKKTINLGSKVLIKNLNTNKKESYQIVGVLDANPFENKISNLSPLATAIVGLKKGDITEVDAPNKYLVEILELEK